MTRASADACFAAVSADAFDAQWQNEEEVGVRMRGLLRGLNEACTPLRSSNPRPAPTRPLPDGDHMICALCCSRSTPPYLLQTARRASSSSAPPRACLAGRTRRTWGAGRGTTSSNNSTTRARSRPSRAPPPPTRACSFWTRGPRKPPSCPRALRRATTTCRSGRWRTRSCRLRSTASSKMRWRHEAALSVTVRFLERGALCGPAPAHPPRTRLPLIQ